MKNHFMIACDVGKSYSKGILFESEQLKKVRFKTKVQEVQDYGADIPANSFLVEFENRKWLIGETVDESVMNFDLSKQTDEHRISLYLTIAKLLEKATAPIGFAEISLATNIPVSIYKSEQHKKQFHDFLFNEGKSICITVNKRPYVFRIKQLIILPEGLGGVYHSIDDYRDKRALNFDIGSLNLSILEYSNLVPSIDKMILSNHGINVLRSTIAEDLTSKFGVYINDSDVEQIFRDKCLFINGKKIENSKEIIENHCRNHVKSILNFAKSRKISFNNIHCINFFGGGSLLLKPFILDEIPHAHIDQDGQFSNVLSYLTVLKAKANA